MVQDNDRLSGRVGASLPIYEFNDTFDEKHLNQNLYWSLNRLYTRALDGQRGLCHLLRYNGKFSDFKKDSRVNTAFDLPYNTYTIKLPLTAINFFSSKAAKEKNYTLRDNANFWRNGTDSDRAKNAQRKIQDEIWRCGKTSTNIMSNGRDENPMHTPDYYYDTERGYVVRDLCARTANGSRYMIDKASYPYLYSIQETYCMPNMFTHHFIVFINGYIYSDAKFFTDNNFLYVFICTNNPADKAYANDLVNENLIKQWRKDEVPFTIMGFPFSTTKGYLGSGSATSIVDSEGIRYTGFAENLTPNMQFRNNIWLLGYSDPEVSTFFLKPHLAKLVKDENDKIHFSSLIDGNFAQSVRYNDAPSKLDEKIASMDRVYMEAFNLKNAYGISNIGIDRSFYIPLEKDGVMHNPVPPQNILLFSYSDSGELKLVHSAIIKLYYPNVYSISNIESDARLFVVWFINTEDTTEHNLFDNPLKNYMAYNPYYKSGILYGTLPKYVMNYVPATVTYDYDDYLVYRRSAKSNHNEYMIDKISEVMKDNPERYEYIYTSLMEKTSFRLHANPKQVVYLKDIKDYDLEAMAVMSNAAACRSYDVPIQFKIPHVGFRIDHHKNTTYRYAIWIDGVLRDVPHIYDTAFTTWIFIPVETLFDATTMEVEMMRVTGRGRIETEIDFTTVDNSVELPRIFTDVSPQSMMISIKKVISPEQLELDDTKSYSKYAKDGAIFTEPDEEHPGGIIVYRVAPDYEMSWMLFGYNKYVDGEMISTLNDQFHENKVIEYPYFDEEGKPQVIYTEREKCKHEALDEFYSRPNHLDWTTGSTIMTDVKEDAVELYKRLYPRKKEHVKQTRASAALIREFKERYPKIEETEDGILGESEREYHARILKLIEEEAPEVYVETEDEYQARIDAYTERFKDSAVMMPLNTAINRNYFKTSDGAYYVTSFESPWPNGFYALDRRRFYQYLPYGESADPIYVTPIGKPTRAEAIEAVTRYAHNDVENFIHIWVTASPMNDDDLMYYNPANGKWYSINDSRSNSEIGIADPIDPDNVKIALALGQSLYPERVVRLEPLTDGRAISEVVIPNMPNVIDASGIYVTAFVHEFETEEGTRYRIEWIPHYNPECSLDYDVSQNYNMNEYTEVPNSRLLIMDDADTYGDRVYYEYEVDGEPYTATACVTTTEELEALRINKQLLNDIDWEHSDKEIKKWYPNSDVYFDNSEPHSFFQNCHAIIQNTDFYWRRHYNFDFASGMKLTTDYFYDDPSFNKFRISINGRRMDHGTDYTTDIRMIESYFRGSPIEITFNPNSPTVKNAIKDSFNILPQIEGKLATAHTFYELMSPESEELGLPDEYSDAPVTPMTNTIYYDVPSGHTPFIWNGSEFEEWDGESFNSGTRITAMVDFEFLPYKDHIVWKTQKLLKREQMVPRQILERPLSFAYYDFYLDGLKLTPDKLEITSPRSFRFAKDVSYEGLYFTIYERCHDKDLYGNAGYMPDSIDDLIASRDNAYKSYLFTTSVSEG